MPTSPNHFLFQFGVDFSTFERNYLVLKNDEDMRSLDFPHGRPMKKACSQAQVRVRLTSMMGTARPIQLAKLTGVLLSKSVLSIPFSARLGPESETFGFSSILLCVRGKE